MEEESRGENSKIRKRRNSSSSSSSLVQRSRFKRAILVGKRVGGSTTPVPTWMMRTASAQKSPAVALTNDEATSLNGGSKANEVSISARKLAATLWEMNKVHAFGGAKEVEGLEDKKELRGRERVGKLITHLSDPSYTPVTEKMDRSRGNGRHRRKTSVAKKQIHLADGDLGGLDSVNDVDLMEIESQTKAKMRMECVIGIRTRLKDVSTGLTMSKELLKVLNRIWGLDEQHSSGMSLVSALRVELDQACLQVDQLINDQRSNRAEIGHLIKHFEEEKAAWRRKEQERIRNTLVCTAEELEVEKKLRKQTERLNKKLGKELADTKASLSKVMKELESEKRAKEILEQVCDELATGIGEDRAEVEELKRKSAKIREEVEKEREMLHLADLLREERVQMKLSEARYHFEEKNAVVERLQNELETYLRNKRGEEDGDGSPNYERIKELEAYLREINFGSCQKREENEGAMVIANRELQDGDDSADSDLHSVELNMDNNGRSYKWGFASDGNAAPKWVSLEKDIKGRKSISENIQWESISLQRKKSGGIDGPNANSIDKSKESPDLSFGERLSEHGLQSQMEAREDEIERYKSVKILRDHILYGPKILSTQNFSSPTRQWGQSLPLQEPVCVVSDGSPVLDGENLRHWVIGNKKERRISLSSRH